MIDKETGNLNIAPAVRVHIGDSLATVAALALGESNVVHGMHTGWKWLFARNVQVGAWYFVLHFGFYNDRLNRISLIVSRERFETLASWDSWSEQAEMQRLAEFKQWIREELGNEGRFSWGTVTADYDMKNASSSIAINYD